MNLPTHCWFRLWQRRPVWLAMAAWLALAAALRAQSRPYIGYVYPAGGQQGTTFSVKLGGQGLDEVNAVMVTGAGVTGRVVEYYRRLNPQEMQLLAEQLKELKRATSGVSATMTAPMAADDAMMMSGMVPNKTPGHPAAKAAAQGLIAKIEQRNREYVQTPACGSIATLVFVEITIAPGAKPGIRELRLATPRGVSNPLVFHVGQLPEMSRKPMITATIQVLGKEAQSLRKRPAEEIEDRITLPCTVNGQIASGEVNRYRFTARQGQRLVITTLARQLVPFIADAVPGWFQPVLTIYDAKGKEVAFADDYRFKPDPAILFEVPQDGEYLFEIRDSIYRGREDFVYRITAGELPFVSCIFPLGGPMAAAAAPKMSGWNLQGVVLAPPAKDSGPGMQMLEATRKDFRSPPIPFAVDLLPEIVEKERNQTPATAQKVVPPVIINGRIDRPDDWDVFQFSGKSNGVIAVEVVARRLDSPLDSVLKLTDGSGKLLAFNDDYEDLGAGISTHYADSYFMAKLPAEGTYYVHLGDTARKGGEEYGYRLRISEPQPDFALRVVPSSVSLRTNATATVTVYVMRKDGFTNSIKLSLKGPPAGITAAPITLSGTQAVARFTLKSGMEPTKEAVNVALIGHAKVNGQEIAADAVAAEDRMQAFLWRHLVPASNFKVLVYDPGYVPPPKHLAPPIIATAWSNAIAATKAPVATNQVAALSPNATNTALAAAGTTNAPPKPKFTRQQVVGRLRQLKLLYEEGLLTDEFYRARIAECEAAQ